MRINNAILSFFWNNFDFFIRFGYCRLGFVSNLMNKLLFWKLYSSDFEKLDKIFEDSLTVLKRNNISIKDKTILEIGPGNSYIIAYNFLMHCAKKVILVDKFPRTIKTKRQREYFKREIEYISKKYGQKPFFINNGEIDGEYIEFINKDLTLTATKIENVDLIFTNSVLEHIKAIKENIWVMSTLVNESGYMLHNIDLRDHYNFNKPFLFYKYSDRVWNNLLTKVGISYTNRLRYDDFVQLFKNMGLKIIYEKKQKENLADAKLCSEFKNKNKEDLQITFWGVILQKSTDAIQNPLINKEIPPKNEKKIDYEERYHSSVKQNENSEMIQKWRTKPYEIIEYVNDLPKDIQILELGSGRGFLTRYLKEQGFKEVIGSDFNKYNIQLAKKLNNVSLKYIDALDINCGDASFDLIISVELIGSSLFHVGRCG